MTVFPIAFEWFTVPTARLFPGVPGAWADDEFDGRMIYRPAAVAFVTALHLGLAGWFLAMIAGLVELSMKREGRGHSKLSGIKNWTSLIEELLRPAL
jgi:hypothetical protein